MFGPECIYSILHKQVNVEGFDVSEIVCCKDSPTIRTLYWERALGLGTQSWNLQGDQTHTCLAFEWLHDNGFSSLWLWLLLGLSITLSTYLCLSFGLHLLLLCDGFVQTPPFNCSWNAFVELIPMKITVWGIWLQGSRLNTFCSSLHIWGGFLHWFLQLLTLILCSDIRLGGLYSVLSESR